MRRIHSAQAAEKQSKMEKAKQLTAEALQKQQNMKIQKNAEAPPKTSDINDLFMASSVKNTAVQGKNTRVHGSLSPSLCQFSYFSTSISGQNSVIIIIIIFFFFPFRP